MTDAKARLLQMIADEPHMGGGGLLKAVGKAQKAAKAAETGARAILPAAEREANLAKMLEGSKVKERLYHGTTENIQRFDPSKAGTKTKNLTTALGTFLSNNPAEASRYAKDWGTQGGNVMPVFAQVTNPYQMPYNEFEGLAMGAWNRMMKDPSFDPNAVVKWNDIEGAKRAAAAVNKHEPDALQDVLNRRDELIAQGHDAVIVNIGGNKEVIVFDPAKIKSAIGNQGTYDLTDPDINKAGGGLLKAIGKAQKMSKATQPIVSAAEHEANLARLLEPSKATMRLYHGTTATEGGKGTEAIRRLKPSKEGALGSGVYLTPSPAHASGYSGIPNDEALNLMLGNPRSQDLGLKALNQRNSGNVLPSQQGGNMLPVYAQIRNPLIIEGTHRDPIIEALTKLGMDEDKAARMVEKAYEEKGYIGKEVESRARAAGYDGLMQYRDGDLSEVVSYNPNAIKSATGNRGTFDINEPDLSKATGGAVHMAGGGRTPKYPWERYEQPKKVAEMRAREINPIAGAVKKGADYATQLIDKGPSFADLVGGVVGAVPFVGPDLRKRMEASNISIPTDFTLGSNMPAEDYEYGQPMQYKKPGISTTNVPTKDVLDAIKVSDLVGTPGLSKVAEDIGYGQMPDPLDLLDAASVGALGYGAIKGGLKGGRKAAGALSNLAKSEAGYKLAQKALEYAPAAQPMNVIKPTGGNWIGGSVEQALKPLRKRTIGLADPAEYLAALEQKHGKEGAAEVLASGMFPMLKENIALNKWIESNLTNYVKKQMATPDDPVRKLAEEGITHMPQNEIDFANQLVPEQLAVKRMNAGQSTHGMGQSNAAKGWESISDERVYGAPASKYMEPIPASQIKRGFGSLVDDNPWIAKLDPNTPIYHPEGYSSFATDLGFDHIVDVLNEDLAAGRIRPEQLNKISMEQAVRRTYEYDQEMAKKMRETQAKVTEGMPVHKEYPEGYKWVELSQPKELPKGWSQEPSGAYIGPNGERTVVNPNYETLGQALKYEGDTMGHCVGGYCPDVAEGRSRIFSLRDAKGEPHVTVEVQPNKRNTSPSEFYQSKDVPQSLLDRITEAEKAGDLDDIGAFNDLVKTSPEYHAYLQSGPPRITQIKGKQNRAPKEDYLPFVQDFVKSGNWSDVGDLRNTGLRDIKKTPKVEEYLKSKNADVPRYLTEDEYQGYEGDFLMDELGKAAENDPLTQRLLNEQPRMAEGGEVKSFFEEKTAKQRLLDMIAEEPHMAGGGLLKAVAKAQKTAKQAKMYSAVDKALEASKRGAGTGMEFANELAKTSGIKKAELVDRGIMVPSKNGPVLNPALTQLPKMSKQDFVSHLNEKYKPPGVRKISITDPKLTDEVIHDKAVKMMADDVNDYVDRHGDADYDDVFDSRYNNDYDQYFERAKEALSEDVGTKYSKYKLPGGENYRENLYQYENPTGKAFLQSHFDEPNVLYHMRQTDRITPTYTSAQIDAIGQRMADAMGTKVESLGSGAPEAMLRQGVISPLEAAQFAHAKGFRNMDIDMSPAQKRALHIEEIQSDWHQKGRDKGYVNMFDKPYTITEEDGIYRVRDQSGQLFEPYLDGQRQYGFMTAEGAENAMKGNMGRLPQPVGMPDAPFKKNWHEHALKQALMDAAEGDYNQLLITPGAEQAKRYDLSQQVDSVEWNQDNGRLYAKRKDNGDYTKIADNVSSENLANYIGKEAASKLIAQPPSGSYKQLSGLDLQIGGEGMAGFYDKMVPSYLNDLGKKYGVRVGEHAVEGDVPYSKTTPTLADVQRLAQEMYGVNDIQALSALPVEQRNAINQAFADRVRAAHTTKLHSFDITPEMREDILNNGLPMYQRGGEVHMAGGGVLKAIGKAQKAAKTTEKAAEAAATTAKVAPTPVAPALIPGLMQKSTAAQIGREERARRQAAAAAEAARVEAAKQTPVPVGYVPHTPKSLNPHVGFRFEAEQPVGIAPSPTIDVGALERSHKGASMLPLPWDLTNRNVRVSSVSGKKLAHDIWTHGGSPYSSDEEHLLTNIGGASGRGIAERIQGREAAARAENKQAGGTGEILHAVNTMGAGSESYALPSSEFAVDVIGRRFMNGEISLKQAEDLSNLVRNYVDPDTKKQPFKNWGGFLSRDGVQQMYTGEGLSGPPGDLRKLIAKNILYSKKNQELLDFNTEDFVNAITHTPLRGIGRGYIGGNLLSNAESSPMKLSKTADYPWLNPYDTNFSATHIGQLEDLVPIQAVMGRKIAPIEQELLAKQAAKSGGKPYTDASLQGSAISALEKRKENVAQFMDSKYFQDLADYFEALKTPLEKKKGGLAHTKKVKRHGNTVSN